MKRLPVQTMQRSVFIGLVLALGACSVEPGSEQWCEQKKDQAKSEWSSSDAMTFARNCLIESSTIGSQAWCDDLGEKPKGEWTADEATSYTKYCII